MESMITVIFCFFKFLGWLGKIHTQPMFCNRYMETTFLHIKKCCLLHLYFNRFLWYKIFRYKFFFGHILIFFPLQMSSSFLSRYLDYLYLLWKVSSFTRIGLSLIILCHFFPLGYYVSFPTIDLGLLFLESLSKYIFKLYPSSHVSNLFLVICLDCVYIGFFLSLIYIIFSHPFKHLFIFISFYMLFLSIP